MDSPSGVVKSKLPRLEKPTEDFSSVVKSKLQTYTRTGQACDRCKVRWVLLLATFSQIPLLALSNSMVPGARFRSTARLEALSARAWLREVSLLPSNPFDCSAADCQCKQQRSLCKLHNSRPLLHIQPGRVDQRRVRERSD